MNKHFRQILTMDNQLQLHFVDQTKAGPHRAVKRVSDSRARGPRFNTQSGNTLSFLLPLIQEGQLSVTGQSMCTKYW